MEIIIESVQLNSQENASQNPFYGVKQHFSERLSQAFKNQQCGSKETNSFNWHKWLGNKNHVEFKSSLVCLCLCSTNDIGPNLLLELPFGITSTKPDPADCNNSLLTFWKPIHVKHGLLYLCSAFSWRFINLDAAFAHGTTHVYKPSLIAKNAFEVLINDVAKWSFDQGLTNGQFSKLAISPHYWNRKVLSMDLVKDDRKKAYSVQFSWSIYSWKKNFNHFIFKCKYLLNKACLTF